ncbi:MAG: hypothetical protein LQ342_003729 [Letrouitia transgressa]|nr:MAG: hypothetical protein LQ342_003729 [Letrouitia transgressa]
MIFRHLIAWLHLFTFLADALTDICPGTDVDDDSSVAVINATGLLTSVPDFALTPSPSSAAAAALPVASYPAKWQIPYSDPPIYLSVPSQGHALPAQTIRIAFARFQLYLDQSIDEHGDTAIMGRNTLALVAPREKVRLEVNSLPRGGDNVRYSLLKAVLDGVEDLMAGWGWREVMVEVSVGEVVHGEPDATVQVMSCGPEVRVQGVE